MIHKEMLPPTEYAGKRIKISLDMKHYACEYVIGTCIRSKYFLSSYALKDAIWSNGNRGQGYAVISKACALCIEVCDKVVTPDDIYRNLLL